MNPSRNVYSYNPLKCASAQGEKNSQRRTQIYIHMHCSIFRETTGTKAYKQHNYSTIMRRPLVDIICGVLLMEQGFLLRNLQNWVEVTKYRGTLCRKPPITIALSGIAHIGVWCFRVTSKFAMSSYELNKRADPT